jgi:F420-0:gamma-glutamyl ligase
MNIKTVKTDIIKAYECGMEKVLDRYLNDVCENSVIAITSKIVSLCEGSVIPIEKARKKDVIISEADKYLPLSDGGYVMLTVKNNIITPNSGVDESNSGGYYVLWPRDPYGSAKICRDFIAHKFGLKNVGVIICDSSTMPLKWGVTGRAIAYSGFKGLNDKCGCGDIYGRKLKMTKIAIADALAAAAVLCMGETNEQTPLAVIEDIPFIVFDCGSPSPEDLKKEIISAEYDLYGPMLKAVKWKKGPKSKAF